MGGDQCADGSARVLGDQIGRLDGGHRRGALEDEHERFPTLFISPESFERRLRFLVKHYEIVPLQAAIEQHRANRPQRA